MPSPFEGHQIIKQRTKSSSTRRSVQIILIYINISIYSSCIGNIVPSYPEVHSICINHFPVPKKGINDRYIYINKLHHSYNDRLRSSQPASAKFCNKVFVFICDYHIICGISILADCKSMHSWIYIVSVIQCSRNEN